MTAARTVAVLRKNNTEQIHVCVVEKPGCALVDVRVFAPTLRSQGEPVPTKAGICIPRTQLGPLIEALRDAEVSTSGEST